MEDKLKQLLKTMKMNENFLSLIFGLVTVLLVGVLIFRMYRAATPSITDNAEQTSVPTATIGSVKVEVKEDGTKVPVELPDTVKVEVGEHLWKIAERYYGSGYNWVDIAKENNLQNPSQLRVGQELKLPKVAVKTIEKSTVGASNTEPKIEGDSYTVVKGDNLWNICVRAYADGYKWSEVAKFNNLAHPNTIEVGQVIKLPR